MTRHGSSDGDAGSGIDLSQFDDEFEDAPVENREFSEVPDGTYQVRVDQVELVNAKSSGKPMLKWTLRIIGPRYAGRLLWRNNVIASKENIRWLKQDLQTCGLDLKKLSELKDRLADLLDIELEVAKRTRGDNTNIYLNKRLVLEQQGGGGGYDQDNPEDDLPF